MKKIFIFLSLFLVFAKGAAHGGGYPMASVKYVSAAAKSYGCNLKNNAPENQAANMKYLLRSIDICNGCTTNYGQGKFATMHAANTKAVEDAMKNLIRIPDADGREIVYDCDNKSSEL
jgi:hypothetical protein